MNRLVCGLVMGLCLASCRTEIAPTVRAEKPKVYVPKPGECEVHDYVTAPDVPAGSKNLGWLSVPHENQTDEETFAALRQAVCAKGGNGFSQAHWIRAAGASVADQPVALEANVWAVP